MDFEYVGFHEIVFPEKKSLTTLSSDFIYFVLPPYSVAFFHSVPLVHWTHRHHKVTKSATREIIELMKEPAECSEGVKELLKGMPMIGTDKVGGLNRTDLLHYVEHVCMNDNQREINVKNASFQIIGQKWLTAP